MDARWTILLLLTLATAGCQSPGPSRAKIPEASPTRPVGLTGQRSKVDSPHEVNGVQARQPESVSQDEDDKIATAGFRTTVQSGSNSPRGSDCTAATAGLATSAACGSRSSRFGRYSPGDVFRQDRRDFFSMLARDARGLINSRDLTLLGGALGGAIAIHQDWDDDVREYVREHPQRWGDASESLGYLGEVQYQVPVLLGVYGYSVYSSNEELHAFSRALLSAYTITGLSTLTVKVIADTERPSREWNDGRFGFPSFHTSSSFAVAAVVDEYEGLPTALPIYAMSGLIGWSRIDERDHDLSDVVFGAALGYVIGKSVARQHRKRESSFRFKPYRHPLDAAGGLAMEWRF